MLEIIIKLIGVLLVLAGIILVYDARIITKKFFGFGDQNDAAKRIKNVRIYNSYSRWINCIFCIKSLDKTKRFMLILSMLVNNLYADVAELVDALVLGTSVNDVGVRVPSSAPKKGYAISITFLCI